MPTAAATAAQAIREVAERYDMVVDASLRRDWNRSTGEFDGRVIDAVVSVTVRFEPGDTAAYLAAERACNEVLGMFPIVRPGSTWGTDSGSVGGHAGLTSGYCCLNASGVGIRLARQFV